MTIPNVELDERDFQALVTEARARIAQKCPEWTEHNVSDPGITLIEQFAYMTEQLIYRVNRIPPRMHIALLDLLDVHLAPAEPARALVRFDLTEPARDPLRIPAHRTEVATEAIGPEPPIVFQVEESFTIVPVRLLACGVHREGGFEWATVTDGVARPGGRAFTASLDGSESDAFYFGFEQPIEKLVLRLTFDVTQARGSGIHPREPPLLWEASCANADWTPVELLHEDHTRGLNVDGHIDLQLPQSTASQRVDAKTHHWLRCTFERQGPHRPYTRPPAIGEVRTEVVGAELSAAHAVRHTNEDLGVSDGTPAQVFRLQNLPALDLQQGERLEVQDLETGKFKPWRRVESFTASREEHRHYRFDPATGEIELGPRIRLRQGWRHYGAIPPKGARLRMSAYRQAATYAGNVDAGALKVMRKSIPRIGSVTNAKGAEDGVVVESIDEARERAALELRTTYRAVTADDFEFLAGEASPRVARANCPPPLPGRKLVVSILPRLEVDPADGDYRTAAARQLRADEMQPDQALRDRVKTYLDEHRLLGTSIEVQPVVLRGVTVVVRALIAPLASREEVRDAIRRALFEFLNPLVGGAGEGWEFGRNVEYGDLFALVRGVEDVVALPLLRMYEYDPLSRRHAQKQIEGPLRLRPGEVVCSGAHVVRCDRSDD